MLSVIEIMLVIWAWKKGWKGFALLPFAIAVFLLFKCYTLGGFDLGFGNFVFDLIATIILITMVTHPRKTPMAVITTPVSAQNIISDRAETLVNGQPPIGEAPDTAEGEKHLLPNND